MLLSSDSELPHLFVCKKGCKRNPRKIVKRTQILQKSWAGGFLTSQLSKESYQAAGRGSQGTSRENNVNNIVLYSLRRTLFSAGNVKLNYALGENNSDFFLSWFPYPNLREIFLTLT